MRMSATGVEAQRRVAAAAKREREGSLSSGP